MGRTRRRLRAGARSLLRARRYPPAHAGVGERRVLGEATGNLSEPGLLGVGGQRGLDLRQVFLDLLEALLNVLDRLAHGFILPGSSAGNKGDPCSVQVVLLGIGQAVPVEEVHSALLACGEQKMWMLRATSLIG